MMMMTTDDKNLIEWRVEFLSSFYNENNDDGNKTETKEISIVLGLAD
jgi:hypothetical protein